MIGIAAFAFGLGLLFGCPVHIVSSLSCNLSTVGIPYTIAPSLPLPRGNASVHTLAGSLYHNLYCCAHIGNDIIQTRKNAMYLNSFISTLII